MMKRRNDDKIPLRRALTYIAASMVIVGGAAFGAFLSYTQLSNLHRNDPKFNLTTIVQKSSASNSLQTAYLTELLELSKDKPINLYRFSVKEGEQKLNESPLIKKASLKKVKPGSLFVEYKMRTPTAILGDFTNTAIDKEGYLIPLKPFFNFKNLPIIYLGLDEIHWGDQLNGPKTEIALALSKVLEAKKLKVKIIDVSKAYDLSYGQRQILIQLKEKGITLIRLSTKNYLQELANYLTMRSHLNQLDQAETVIIDLRIPHLAFIEKN